MKIVKRIKAKTGDMIVFRKKGIFMLGEVSIVRDNSVIVKIDSNLSEKVGIENACTVLNHNNYQVMEPNPKGDLTFISVKGEDENDCLIWDE